MEVQVNKKTMKIIIAVLIIVAIVIGGIFAAKAISTQVKINKTKEKLAQIDAKELEEKIINKLKETKLYYQYEVEDSDSFIGSMIMNGTNELEDYICVTTMAIDDEGPFALLQNPCFKISSGSDGKFKNIEYVDSIMDENIVEDAIKEILKEDYNVDMKIAGSSKYNKKFNKYLKDYKNTNTGDITYVDEDFFLALINEITGREYKKVPNDFKKYRTVTFGIDF